ncbi:circumsporozoite protein-like [Condylostylus longicornis]|uniref:circumsporozoite protein-like n=1 Tax=Condylostylus longicornis TaxID=2530218 RepID=UPI00244E38D6|nr:circumsporozoite protein-like [Condylostylus longicornis]
MSNSTETESLFSDILVGKLRKRVMVFSTASYQFLSKIKRLIVKQQGPTLKHRNTNGLYSGDEIVSLQSILNSLVDNYLSSRPSTLPQLSSRKPKAVSIEDGNQGIGALIPSHTHDPIPSHTHDPIPSHTHDPIPSHTHDPIPSHTHDPIPSHTHDPIPSHTHDPIPSHTHDPIPSHTHDPIPSHTHDPIPSHTHDPIPSHTHDPIPSHTHDPIPSHTHDAISLR